MIVSHTARLFIATPTKTGTFSLEALASRRANRGNIELAAPPSGNRTRRMHRMTPDPSWRGYRGYLLVRNPWARWVSVYEHMRASNLWASWGAAEVQGTLWGGRARHPTRPLGPPMSFADFLGWLLVQRATFYTTNALARRGSCARAEAYRSPWIWLDPLTLSRSMVDANCDGAAELLHIEHLAAELPPLFDGAPDLDLHVDRLNAAANNRPNPTQYPHWADYWETPHVMSLATRLGVEQEAHDLGYSRSPL